MKFQDLEFKAGYVYQDNYSRKWMLNSEGINFVSLIHQSSLTECYNQYELLQLTFERVVQWDKIPVDTKIFVRDGENENWTPRYFASFERGCVMAFPDGQTSFTCTDDRKISWSYAELAETMD
jgi:hypothetical protein